MSFALEHQSAVGVDTDNLAARTASVGERDPYRLSLQRMSTLPGSAQWRESISGKLVKNLHQLIERTSEEHVAVDGTTPRNV